MEEKEKQSQRQKKRFAKKAKAEIATDNKAAAGPDTEESKVNKNRQIVKSRPKKCHLRWM